MLPDLTHFTNSIDSVVNILMHGFAWQRNDRRVIELLLEDVDFSSREPQSFGQVCFTEKGYESNRDETKFFGTFGISVSERWAQRNFAQPVIYVPNEGPILDAFRFLFVQTYQRALAEQKYPDDAMMQMWEVSSAMAGVSGQPLYAALLHIYEYMEPALHSKEREWRIVNPNPDWSISRSTEDAIKNVSPPLGWAEHLHVLKAQPEDVDAIICLKRDEPELQRRLPDEYQDIPINAH